jgi:serine/threonine protein kinase
LWKNQANLSLQLDVFLQLNRHLEQFPLDLENWALTEVLHNTNDSIIYKAETHDGVLAAIKRFKFSPSTLSTEDIQQLLIGADKQRLRCCSSGLIRFYEGAVNDQAFYLVMEYLNYGSLRQALNGCGNQLPLTHALEWFQEIAIALDCVHKAGIIHRDLKIDNIQLRKDGTLVLTDYGISKRLLLDAGFVYENELHCSPHYVSPEQITGDACTKASDIYSLGVIFYELLTGHKPYSAKQAHELMMCHIMAPVPVFPDDLKHYQPLLDKMMAKNPKDRFLSAIDAIGSPPMAA